MDELDMEIDASFERLLIHSFNLKKIKETTIESLASLVKRYQEDVSALVRAECQAEIAELQADHEISLQMEREHFKDIIEGLKATIEKQNERLDKKFEADGYYRGFNTGYNEATKQLQASHKAELEKVFQAYNDCLTLLGEELRELSSLATSHSWESPRFEAEEKHREIIKTLKASVEGK